MNKVSVFFVMGVERLHTDSNSQFQVFFSLDGFKEARLTFVLNWLLTIVAVL
jgi:hypothetical protein